MQAVRGMLTEGTFAAEDTATEKYRIITKPGGDELDKDPESTDVESYSQFDSVPFEAMVRDTPIYYDVFRHSLQILTHGTIEVGTGILVNLFTSESEEAYSFIEIFFMKSAPYYNFKGCLENVVMFEMPEPDQSGDRVWTFVMSEQEVVFRCNGKEFGRVTAGGSNVKRDCESFFGNAKKIKFPSQYDTASDGFRVLCLDGCMNIDPWRPIVSYYTEIDWKISEFSLQIRTVDGKASWLSNTIGFYESEESFSMYQRVNTFHGETHYWVWIRGCTEYWIPLRYHSFDYVIRRDLFSATFTFHEDYASVISKGELLWTFYYDSDISMDSCVQTISKFTSNAFLYYEPGHNPKVGDEYRLLSKPNDDSKLVNPEPSFKDYSEYSNRLYQVFLPDTPLKYNLVRTPLQLKTEIELPEHSNLMTLSLLDSSGEEIGSIAVGAWKFAAYFRILPCQEGAILISIPKPLPDTETRVWTVEPSETEIVLRCNGLELGRVAKGSHFVLDSCDDIFGGNVNSVSIQSEVTIFYRILCSGSDECGGYLILLFLNKLYWVIAMK